MTEILVIRNAKEIVTVCSNGERFKCGDDQGTVSVLKNASIAIENGKITSIGDDDSVNHWVTERYKVGEIKINTIDARGKSIIPGFVDSHTHPVWSGDRVHEFVLKLAGATYMEIHAMGGGIGFTVNHTKSSSKQELTDLLIKRLNRMSKFGTTLVECKSGYGLELETEMKMLEVLHEAQSVIQNVDIVSTYLGAHSVPKGKTAEDFTNEIVNDHIPRIKALIEENKISPSLIDVFCETGVFSVDQTKRILLAGKEIGLESNFHGEELSYIKGGELCGEIGVLAMTHCEEVSPEGIIAMSVRPTIATLLPTTAYLLHLKYPPARQMISGIT